MKNRIEEFYSMVCRSVFEARKLTLFEPYPEASQFSRLDSAYRPIVKYLAFGRRYLISSLPEAIPLNNREISDLDNWSSNIGVYKTREDFHVASVGKLHVPNRIVDVILIGNPSSVEQRRKVLARERASLRDRLLRRVRWLKCAFEANPVDGVDCIAYRGKLAVRGRFPGDDIDLLISCQDATCYDRVRDFVTGFARERAFRYVDWIEMHEDILVERRDRIYVDPSGIFRLDCHTTIGEAELERVSRQNATEALWTLGVLQTARPIIGESYLLSFLKKFSIEVKQNDRQE